MTFLKKYPIPIAGLILSLFTLGNLLRGYNQNIHSAMGCLGALFFLIYVLKLIVLNYKLKEDLNNPVVASVFLTFPMSSMLFSAYLKSVSPKLGMIIWGISVSIHILLLIWFSNKFLRNFSMLKLFPSWYIVYVGIAVASITAPAFNMLLIGKIAFWFAFVSFLTLLIPVCLRVWKIKQIPTPALPTLVIMSAPASLLLAGYLSSFQNKNSMIIYLLLILSLSFYGVVLYFLPKLLRLKFSPAYAAFTFPLAISAVATKLTYFYLKPNNSYLVAVFRFQEVVAVLIIGWVLICYLKFLFQPINKK